MNKVVKRLLLILGVLVLAVVFFVVLGKLRGVPNYSDKYAGVDLNAGVEGLDREGTYTEYINSHANAAHPTKAVEVDVTKYIDATDVEVRTNVEGEAKVLYTGDDSIVTWKVNVPEEGMYNVSIEYLTVKSRGVVVERSFKINGENPFTDANKLAFTRQWTDASEPKIDNQGNMIRPSQVEVFSWQKAFLRDDMGYVTEPYQFFFNKGENEITFECVNEPVILRKITLSPITALPTYAEYKNSQPAAGTDVSNFVKTIQGESAIRRSEPSLYGKYDRSSHTTQPNSITKTVLNYTGGDAWSEAGMWVEWDFEVPADGYYNITVKGRQNYARGSVSNRTLYIDGEIPFEEARTVSFGYDNNWNLKTISDENGNPYEFYMTAGTHTIRLEATLGDMGAILGKLEDSTVRLTQIYRRILVYTGANPDKYRDYHIELVYPEVIDAMDLEAKRLYSIIDEVVGFTGQKADKIAAAQTLARQLETFVERPDKISVNFTTFKDNITALGTAMLNMREAKLDVDYIVVSGTGAKVPKDKETWYGKAWHEVSSFVASFFVDYDAVGDVYDKKDEVVKVWIATGRDQGTILKAMIDDTFTPNTGIKVNVEIVAADALLNAVVAGRGPDVVLSVGADQPVNYALRGASEDLTQFEGYEEVLGRFKESAYRAYQYNGGLYAIPETQTYNVMFYRKDILEQLGLEIPNTWDELIALLPTIQGNNLTVGFPSPTNATLPDLSLYYTLLYQAGGEVYDDIGKTTIIDSEEGARAFSKYTSFYVDYGMPTEYDFVSRFRSGEMPIGIANYSTFNTLVVSAPEIRGLWDFTLVPGTEKTDANGNTYIDRSVYSTGTCTMMIKSDKQSVKEKGWEFIKWWSSADAQVRFGREMEALLGSSARYATANLEAFDQLAWSADNIAVLKEQWNYTVGFREVAGGYYTGRHIVNAVRRVINEKEDPRETILDYAIKIDEELLKKRKEFGLE